MWSGVLNVPPGVPRAFGTMSFSLRGKPPRRLVPEDPPPTTCGVAMPADVDGSPGPCCESGVTAASTSYCSDPLLPTSSSSTRSASACRSPCSMLPSISTLDSTTTQMKSSVGYLNITQTLKYCNLAKLASRMELVGKL